MVQKGNVNQKKEHGADTRNNLNQMMEQFLFIMYYIDYKKKKQKVFFFLKKCIF